MFRYVIDFPTAPPANSLSRQTAVMYLGFRDTVLLKLTSIVHIITQSIPNVSWLMLIMFFPLLVLSEGTFPLQKVQAPWHGFPVASEYSGPCKKIAKNCRYAGPINAVELSFRFSTITLIFNLLVLLYFQYR